MGSTIAGHTVFRCLSPGHSGSRTRAALDGVRVCAAENWNAMAMLSTVFCQQRRFLTKRKKKRKDRNAEGIHHVNPAPIFPPPASQKSSPPLRCTSSVNQK